MSQGRRLSPERFERAKDEKLTQAWREGVRRYLFPALGVFAVLAANAFIPLLRGPTPPKPLPAVVASAIGGPSQTLAAACSGYQRCLITYITPWCPGCRSSVPFIRNARAFLQTLGQQSVLQVIVGDGADAQLQALASEVGGLVFIDDKQQLNRALNVRSVPAWFLVNEQGMIIDRASAGGANGPPIQELMAYFISHLFSDEEVKYFVAGKM